MNAQVLKLSFHLRRYAFGARRIPEVLGKQGLPEGVVAETWEVSDYQDTSATVINGALAGTPLRQLVLEHPDALVGEGWRGPHFPLLVKFLDASHMLPVHLHADDATARRKYGEANGKTEAWHILWAAPAASVLAGVRPGVTDDDLVRAFRAQAYDSVMLRYPVTAGDTVYVPGGVLHSFGPDTLILEVQQTSDLAQTVMPTDLYGSRLSEETWERNVAETLDELRRDYLPRPERGLSLEEGARRRVIGCASPHFALERWHLSAGYHEAERPPRCVTFSNVGAPLRLVYPGGSEWLGRAESCIVPAAIGDLRLEPDGEADLVVSYLPDLERDIVAPLREAGYTEAQVAALGELGQV